MLDAKKLSQQRAAARQSQFLEVLSPDEATTCFRAHLSMAPLGSEIVSLADALGRTVAEDIRAGVDVPGFDRANVDGFAVRAADTVGASEEAPCILRLNDDVITPGVQARNPVTTGNATVVATGALIPRGADAVVMVEDTELAEQESETSVLIRRAIAPGAFITFAGTDIGQGETVLRAGQLLTSREIGVLAAVGCDKLSVYRKPRVAVISTGNEVVAPGKPLPVGCVYDSNAAIVAAAVNELGGEAVCLGAVADDASALREVLDRALQYDMVILSGGTSKGAGDLSYHVLDRLQEPGVLVHGVALKPGKPLCLAVSGTIPVIILPGFPTSAIFTFHQFVAPVVRAFAGLPQAQQQTISATLPVRIVSDRGRMEFVMIGLIRGDAGFAAYPMGKNSGAVTAFSHADGFIRVDTETEQLAAGSTVEVHLLSDQLEPADLVSIGSHCVGLDRLLGRLQTSGVQTKSLHVGSTGGLAAVRRGECDIAGIHLLDPQTGEYNRPFLEPDMELIKGYRRLQGIVYRADDQRFADKSSPHDAVRAALADPDCLMVNRNAGSGTRILIDGLLEGAQPPGYAVQPKSHNAVATAVAQGRADWGVAIDTVARFYGLGFIPLLEEHYDFAVPKSRLQRPAVQRFIRLLQEPEAQAELRELGFRIG